MFDRADPDIVASTWATALGAFEPDDIRHALDAMARSFQDFPPTLFQFRQLCADSRARRVQTVAKLTGPREPIPEHAKAWLGEFLGKHRVGGPRR